MRIVLKTLMPLLAHNRLRLEKADRQVKEGRCFKYLPSEHQGVEAMGLRHSSLNDLSGFFRILTGDSVLNRFYTDFSPNRQEDFFE